MRIHRTPIRKSSVALAALISMGLSFFLLRAAKEKLEI